MSMTKSFETRIDTALNFTGEVLLRAFDATYSILKPLVSKIALRLNMIVGALDHRFDMLVNPIERRQGFVIRHLDNEWLRNARTHFSLEFARACKDNRNLTLQERNFILRNNLGDQRRYMPDNPALFLNQLDYVIRSKGYAMGVWDPHLNLIEFIQNGVKMLKSSNHADKAFGVNCQRISEHLGLDILIVNQNSKQSILDYMSANLQLRVLMANCNVVGNFMLQMKQFGIDASIR